MQPTFELNRASPESTASLILSLPPRHLTVKVISHRSTSRPPPPPLLPPLLPPVVIDTLASVLARPAPLVATTPTDPVCSVVSMRRCQVRSVPCPRTRAVAGQPVASSVCSAVTDCQRARLSRCHPRGRHAVIRAARTADRSARTTVVCPPPPPERGGGQRRGEHSERACAGRRCHRRYSLL